MCSILVEPADRIGANPHSVDEEVPTRSTRKTAARASADPDGPDAPAEGRHVETVVAGDIAQPGHRRIRQTMPEQVPANMPGVAREDADVAGDVQAVAMLNDVVDGRLREVGADVAPGGTAV